MRRAAAPDVQPAVGATGGFRIEVRAYFQDTDAGGVVYHGRYLDWFERARMEWLRAIGAPASELAAREHVLFIIRSVELDYLRPARLDDALGVQLRVEAVGGAQVMLRQQVTRGDEPLVTGRIHLACVAADTLRPARIPPNLRNRLAAWLPPEAIGNPTP